MDKAVATLFHAQLVKFGVVKSEIHTLVGTLLHFVSAVIHVVFALVETGFFLIPESGASAGKADHRQ